jgi:hypothetical protein
MKTLWKSMMLACALVVSFVSVTCALEAPDKSTFPKGWGGGGKGYEFQLDNQTTRSGKASATIKFVGPDGDSFGTFTQGFDPGKYIGKRVRLSGYIKTSNAGKASLWMRVDGKDPKSGSLAFDNMQNGRELSGTQDWKKCEVVLDVAEEAKGVYFGIILSGKGQLWADDLKLEIVGNDVPVTDMMVKSKEPVNLDFEN